MTPEEKRERKRENDRRYRERHREELRARQREYNRRYIETHEEQRAESIRKYREKNRDVINERNRKRYSENPEAFKARNDKYIETHKDYVKERNKKYAPKRSEYNRVKEKTDTLYRFRRRVWNLIYHYMKKAGYTGNKKVWDIIGCDFNSFLLYIQNQFEDGMSLENYGIGHGKWNIDHIEPISNAKTNEDIERINHYTNMRPMWSVENTKKGKKTL